MPIECHIVDMPASLSPTGGQTEVATLRTLRIAKHFPFFLAVAEEQNLHRAAERLNIAQSALSRRISDLERELGGTILFERQARGVAITEAGRVLAEDVRRILLDIEEAGRRVLRVAHGDLGTLRVAFSEAMIRRPVLPVALKRFRETYPDVDLRPMPLTSDAQRNRLRGGETDIGFVIEEAGDREDFELMRLGIDQFVLAVPDDHRLANVDAVQLRDLIDEPLILPGRQVSPRLFGRMMGAFDARGISPIIAVEIAAVDIAYGLVSAGLGLAIVTAARPETAPPGIVLKNLADFDLPLPLSMIWPKDRELPLVDRFVAIVTAVAAEF
jgi:DNA-binding transcriptional LysR family regulator